MAGIIPRYFGSSLLGFNPSRGVRGAGKFQTKGFAHFLGLRGNKIERGNKTRFCLLLNVLSKVLTLILRP